MNGKIDVYDLSDEKSTVPAPDDMTGLISTAANNSKVIRGDADTDFTQIQEGEFIYAADQIRKVLFVHIRYNPLKDNGDGTKGGYEGPAMLTIDKAFDAPLVTEEFQRVKTRLFSKIRIDNNGGADGAINGNVFGDGKHIELGPTANGLEPLAVDATGTNFLITTEV